jgi:hypothetical protein
MEERNPGEYLVVVLLFGIVLFHALRWIASGLRNSCTTGRYLSRGFYASHIRKSLNLVHQFISAGSQVFFRVRAQVGLGIFKLQVYASRLRGAISRSVSLQWQVVTDALTEISLIGLRPDGCRFALLYHVHYG